MARTLGSAFTADSLGVRELIRKTAKDNAQAEAEADEKAAAAADESADPSVPEMELQPFEHYDYVVLMFRNEQDFSAACERLGIEKVSVTYPAGLKKIGLGRVVDGAAVMARLAS